MLTKDKGRLKMKKKEILDKGFVILLDYLASDNDVAQAARVSTGTKSEPGKDTKLIHFLIAHRHETPFEHLIFRFHIKCPFFVARQWMRHRVASYNEVSARYRAVTDEFYVPAHEDIPECFNEQDIARYRTTLEESYEVYSDLLEKVKDNKVHRARAREVFRGLLGTAYYTEFYWTINFRSLMNFIALRTDPTAQLEIRRYAEAIKEMIKDIIPVTLEAFEENVLSKKGTHE